MTNQFLSNFAHSMSTVEEIQVPEVSQDIILSRNNKIKFIFESLLAKGQDLDIENLPDLLTLGKQELYQIKESFLESKI